MRALCHEGPTTTKSRATTFSPAVDTDRSRTMAAHTQPSTATRPAPGADVRGDGTRPDVLRPALRSDIQGLRALAVGIVLVYHLVPSSLGGGFVGVDVFFVVSGFLITSHLISRPPRTGGDLARFWARRARRLLPAALLVLGVTVAATWAIAPQTLWEQTARQAGGATLYMVNWLLAADAVDYLAADDAPTGVQHYWSLAVEEQFYLAWPLLIAALAWAARRTGVRRGTAWGVGLATVAATAFAWSVHLTGTNPGRAYFETPTRVWELAAGGLVALALAPRSRPTGPASRGPVVVPVLVGWAGLAAVVVAAVTYDASTPFPGWTAALPVLGTCAVIAARTPVAWWSPGGVLSLRPAQWLGDVSYSVYLWHWPLVVLVGVVSAPLGALDVAGIVVLTLLLAWATKTWVEDPFRGRAWSGRTRATYVASAVGMAGVLTVCGALWATVQGEQEEAELRVAAALSSGDPCLGAGALDPRRDCAEPQGPPVPSPLQAAEDKPDAYPEVSGGKDCWAERPDFPVVTCGFGDRDAEREVVLLGNSHAGHWLPTLQELAEARDWRVTTVLASQCASAEVDQRVGDGASDEASVEACREWTRTSATEVVERDPDLVVVSNRISVPAVGEPGRGDSAEAYAEGYARVLERLAAAGIPVAVVADTPAPGDGQEIESVPDCLAASLPETDPCAGEREEWMPIDPDPAVVAARRVEEGRVEVVDLNDRICDGERCESVVGGVVVYFDASHLTATYARTLAPAFDEALREVGLLPLR